MAQMNTDNEESAVNNQEDQPETRPRRGPYNRIDPATKFAIARHASENTVQSAIAQFANLNLAPSTVCRWAVKYRTFQRQNSMCSLCIPSISIITFL